MYFGHPINTYGTKFEEKLLKIIKQARPDFKIENPNQLHHQEGYQQWKKDTGNGMDYFFKVVLPKCDTGIFLPFSDGAWGAGVYGEAEWFFKRNKKTILWTIYKNGYIFSLDYDQFQRARKLSVEDTIKRVRDEKGEMIPF